MGSHGISRTVIGLWPFPAPILTHRSQSHALKLPPYSHAWFSQLPALCLALCLGLGSPIPHLTSLQGQLPLLSPAQLLAGGPQVLWVSFLKCIFNCKACAWKLTSKLAAIGADDRPTYPSICLKFSVTTTIKIKRNNKHSPPTQEVLSSEGIDFLGFARIG